MANFDLLVIGTGGKQQRRPSADQTIDFTAVRIGVSNLSIAESGGDFDFGAVELLSSAAPTTASSLANKGYVDNAINGLRWKNPVRAVSIANITLENEQTIDGVALVAGNRALVAGQTAGEDNGIYVVVDGGAWTRSTDADASGEFAQMAVFVQEGTAYADTGWVLSTDGAITLDTTALVYTQFTGAGQIIAGDGLTKSGNQLDVGAGDGIAVAADSIAVAHDGEGLAFNTGNLILELDGGTLSKSATGLKIADSGVGTTQIADDAVTQDKIADNAVGNLQLADSAVDTAEIADSAVETAKINDAAVTADKLAAAVAGDGLTGGAGSALAVGAGDAIKVAADAVAVDFALDKVNDNAGAITVRQVVYVKADGDVDLARADVANLETFELGLVEDASIAATATGKITLRRGAVVPGFTGLTPGQKYYVSKATAGLIELYSAITFVAGDKVYCVGRALSATQLSYDPHFEFEY